MGSRSAGYEEMNGARCAGRCATDKLNHFDLTTHLSSENRPPAQTMVPLVALSFSRSNLRMVMIISYEDDHLRLK